MKILEASKAKFNCLCLCLTHRIEQTALERYASEAVVQTDYNDYLDILYAVNRPAREDWCPKFAFSKSKTSLLFFILRECFHSLNGRNCHRREHHQADVNRRSSRTAASTIIIVCEWMERRTSVTDSQILAEIPELFSFSGT